MAQAIVEAISRCDYYDEYNHSDEQNQKVFDEILRIIK